MSNDGMLAKVLWEIGPVLITDTIVTSWVIIVCLAALGWFSSRKLSLSPTARQTTAEAIVTSIETAIANVAPNHVQRLLPFIATLWIFLTIANLSGLIPGVHSPTRDLSATAALAFLVFLASHWFGIGEQGIKAYLQHYLRPNPILLPLHILSEITRTIALAVRLFGNIMSLEMAAMLILLVAGFLAPVPILMLHIIEALVQAYIFGMLALVYIAGGLQTQHAKRVAKQQPSLSNSVSEQE